MTDGEMMGETAVEIIEETYPFSKLRGGDLASANQLLQVAVTHRCCGNDWSDPNGVCLNPGRNRTVALK
jgi:hypothetical protein